MYITRISYDTWWESSWIKSHRKNRTNLLIINLKIKISTKDAFKGGRSLVKAKEASGCMRMARDAQECLRMPRDS